MNIKIVSMDLRNNFKHSYRKEDGFFLEYATLNCKTGDSFMISRWYATTARIYCCVWIDGKDTHGVGCDYAGGWGYDRVSAAFAGAISAAGIEISENIAGVGRSAVEQVIKLITDKLTNEKFIFHTANP